MDEYIKREDVKNYIKNYGKEAISDGMQALDPVDDIVLLANGVDLIPTADVVEVVRCKDCENWNRGDCYRQELTLPDDFCSYSKKKEGAEK